MTTIWAPSVPPMLKTEDETDEKDSHAFPGTHMRFHVKQFYIQYMEVSTDLPMQPAAFGLPSLPGLPDIPGVPHPPIPSLPPVLPPLPPGIPVVDPPLPIPPGFKSPLPVPPHPTGKTEWRKNGPRVRSSADIHMTPTAVESMKGNEQSFADIMSTFTSGPAALFFQLGHETYKYGLEHAKNKDGSLDIHIDEKGAKAGNHLILLPVSTCMAIIQAA